MAGWLPWIGDTPVYVQLRVGGMTIALERLNLGDTKTIERRERMYNDLIHTQRTRPRARVYDLKFGAFLKRGDIPRRWVFQRFVRAMKEFPGWPVTLIWPDKTVLHGIIVDYSYEEIGDCQMMISLKFSVMREYPQGKVLAI